MKTKIAAFLVLLFFYGSFRTTASENDTIWTIYHYNGYSISVLGGDLYAGIKSRVVIKSDDPNEKFGFSYNNGIIESIGKGWFYITPGEIGESELKIIGEADSTVTYKIHVYPVPDPRLYLIEDKHHWNEAVSKDDILKSAGIVVKNRFNNYEVVSFTFTFFTNSGDLISCPNLGDRFSPHLKKLLKNNIVIGKKIYLEDIVIKNPDSTKRAIPFQTYMVIDNYENEFIRKTVNIKPFSNDLGLLKSDLRIKIDGNPTKEDIQNIKDFTTGLNGVLETIKVKIVDRQPSLTIVFDSVHDTTAADMGFGVFVKSYSSVFFPFHRKFIMYIEPDAGYDTATRNQEIKKNILRLFGNFTKSMQELSLLNGSNELTPYDIYMIKTLYSPGGEEEVKKMINADYSNPDRSGVFVLILILSICLMFVFSEIYQHYSFNFLLNRIKFKLVKRIIESILVAQIPVIAVILLALVSSGRPFHELSKIPEYELFLIPLFVLWGVSLYFLDMLLKKIRINWLNILTDFILTIFCVILAYQIIYFFRTPEIINFRVISWEILIIPVLIALYRLYSRFQTNKITSLLQEKELELAKQKELKFKSDLNALQARINPHFLYNALNSLASLAYIDAGKTEKMALSLSKLFRYNINKEDEHYATVKDEIDMAGIYLEVEKNRFEDKLDYSIEVQKSLNDFLIPKFILQPLAENAVKHGVSKITGKGFIKIKIFEQDQKVIVEIYDNGPEFPGGLISGYGLQNTYEKLKLLYKKPFGIEFVNQPEKKLVILLTK